MVGRKKEPLASAETIKRREDEYRKKLALNERAVILNKALGMFKSLHTKEAPKSSQG